jgi:carboxyl-terminal processing protease
MKIKGIKIILISTVILVGGLFAFNNPDERYFEITKNLDIFATLYKEVNAYYVDEVNPNALMRTGINAMLASLDPYTNYIPEDDIEDYRTMTTGQYGGIGAVIGRSNGKNVIILPYEGFPAEKSGLKIGDELIEIDGVDIRDRNTSEISQLLKGQANTELTVTVLRYGQQEPIEIQMTREKITIDNVPYYGMVSEDIGYIKLSDFTTGAGKEVKKALETLQEEGAAKIILDLRDNPGGLLNEAVNVSNVFIPRGNEVVSTKGKMTDWNKTYKALNQPVDTEVPVAVLISRRSASAAEIVSGVIQDYDRGILVGEKTFGKGLVQATRPLTYNSQLKITTAKYYIPSGRCIQAINYSERNEEGAVTKIPDSLKIVFETSNGRKVYDGGGVDPDVLVEPRNLAPITATLLTKGLIFDYALKYYHEHPEIDHPRKFKLTDEEYNAFVRWLTDKDYDYTTRVEQTIDELRKFAREEKSFDHIKDKIDALEVDLRHSKEKDLRDFDAEIREALEDRIVQHYYLMRGMYEASFDDDVQVLKAVEVLDNMSQYEQILAKATE